MIFSGHLIKTNIYGDTIWTKNIGDMEDGGDGEKVLCEDVSISQLERFYNFLGLVLHSYTNREGKLLLFFVKGLLVSQGFSDWKSAFIEDCSFVSDRLLSSGGSS